MKRYRLLDFSIGVIIMAYDSQSVGSKVLTYRTAASYKVLVSVDTAASLQESKIFKLLLLPT